MSFSVQTPKGGLQRDVRLLTTLHDTNRWGGGTAHTDDEVDEVQEIMDSFAAWNLCHLATLRISTIDSSVKVIRHVLRFMCFSLQNILLRLAYLKRVVVKLQVWWRKRKQSLIMRMLEIVRFWISEERNWQTLVQAQKFYGTRRRSRMFRNPSESNFNANKQTRQNVSASMASPMTSRKSIVAGESGGGVSSPERRQSSMFIGPGGGGGGGGGGRRKSTVKRVDSDDAMDSPDESFILGKKSVPPVHPSSSGGGEASSAEPGRRRSVFLTMGDLAAPKPGPSSSMDTSSQGGDKSPSVSSTTAKRRASLRPNATDITSSASSSSPTKSPVPGLHRRASLRPDGPSPDTDSLQPKSSRGRRASAIDMGSDGMHRKNTLSVATATATRRASASSISMGQAPPPPTARSFARVASEFLANNDMNLGSSGGPEDLFPRSQSLMPTTARSSSPPANSYQQQQMLANMMSTPWFQDEMLQEYRDQLMEDPNVKFYSSDIKMRTVVMLYREQFAKFNEEWARWWPQNKLHIATQEAHLMATMYGYGQRMKKLIILKRKLMMSSAKTSTPFTQVEMDEILALTPTPLPAPPFLFDAKSYTYPQLCAAAATRLPLVTEKLFPAALMVNKDEKIKRAAINLARNPSPDPRVLQYCKLLFYFNPTVKNLVAIGTREDAPDVLLERYRKMMEGANVDDASEDQNRIKSDGEEEEEQDNNEGDDEGSDAVSPTTTAAVSAFQFPPPADAVAPAESTETLQSLRAKFGHKEDEDEVKEQVPLVKPAELIFGGGPTKTTKPPPPALLPVENAGAAVPESDGEHNQQHQQVLLVEPPTTRHSDLVQKSTLLPPAPSDQSSSVSKPLLPWEKLGKPAPVSIWLKKVKPTQTISLANEDPSPPNAASFLPPLPTAPAQSVPIAKSLSVNTTENTQPHHPPQPSPSIRSLVASPPSSLRSIPVGTVAASGGSNASSCGPTPATTTAALSPAETSKDPPKAAAASAPPAPPLLNTSLSLSSSLKPSASFSSVASNSPSVTPRERNVDGINIREYLPPRAKSRTSPRGPITSTTSSPMSGSGGNARTAAGSGSGTPNVLGSYSSSVPASANRASYPAYVASLLEDHDRSKAVTRNRPQDGVYTPKPSVTRNTAVTSIPTPFRSFKERMEMMAPAACCSSEDIEQANRLLTLLTLHNLGNALFHKEPTEVDQVLRQTLVEWSLRHSSTVNATTTTTTAGSISSGSIPSTPAPAPTTSPMPHSVSSGSFPPAPSSMTPTMPSTSSASSFPPPTKFLLPPGFFSSPPTTTSSSSSASAFPARHTPNTTTPSTTSHKFAFTEFPSIEPILNQQNLSAAATATGATPPGGGPAVFTSSEDESLYSSSKGRAATAPVTPIQRDHQPISSTPMQRSKKLKKRRHAPLTSTGGAKQQQHSRSFPRLIGSTPQQPGTSEGSFEATTLDSLTSSLWRRQSLQSPVHQARAVPLTPPLLVFPTERAVHPFFAQLLSPKAAQAATPVLMGQNPSTLWVAPPIGDTDGKKPKCSRLNVNLPNVAPFFPPTK